MPQRIVTSLKHIKIVFQWSEHEAPFPSPSRIHKAKKGDAKDQKRTGKNSESLFSLFKIPKHKQFGEEEVDISGLIKMTWVRNALKKKEIKSQWAANNFDGAYKTREFQNILLHNIWQKRIIRERLRLTASSDIKEIRDVSKWYIRPVN